MLRPDPPPRGGSHPAAGHPHWEGGERTPLSGDAKTPAERLWCVERVRGRPSGTESVEGRGSASLCCAPEGGSQRQGLWQRREDPRPEALLAPLPPSTGEDGVGGSVEGRCAVGGCGVAAGRG